MKQIVVVALLVFLGAGIWRIGESLSSDAIGMALGVIFGVLAGLPVALVTLAASRRRNQYESESGMRQSRGDGAYPYYPPQPPVIVVTGGPQLPGSQNAAGYLPGGQESGSSAWTGHRNDRVFTVVGEKEGLVEEW